MTETVNVPVTLYRTPDGKHTCALNWKASHLCPFLFVVKLGIVERCFFDNEKPLQRDETGFGWLIPSDKCPLVKVEK